MRRIRSVQRVIRNKQVTISDTKLGQKSTRKGPAFSEMEHLWSSSPKIPKPIIEIETVNKIQLVNPSRKYV